MNFKSLMITTIACSAMTQFAMADITFSTANSCMKIGNDGMLERQSDIFDAREPLKEITLDSIKGLKQQDADKLAQTVENFILRQCIQQTAEVQLTVKDSDKTASLALTNILEKIKNIGVITFDTVSLEDFANCYTKQSNCFKDTAQLNIINAKTKTTAFDLSVFGHKNITKIFVETTNASTSYLGIKDTKEAYPRLAELSANGNLYWADDKAGTQEDLSKAEHHGGGMWTVSLTPTVKTVNLFPNLWAGSWGGYNGLTSIALDTENAEKGVVDLNLGYKVTALYLVDKDLNSEKAITFLKANKEKLKQLANLTIPNQSCYSPIKTESGVFWYDFLWLADTFTSARTSKSDTTQSKVNLLPLKYQDGKLTTGHDDTIRTGDTTRDKHAYTDILYTTVE